MNTRLLGYTTDIGRHSEALQPGPTLTTILPTGQENEIKLEHASYEELIRPVVGG